MSQLATYGSTSSSTSTPTSDTGSFPGAAGGAAAGSFSSDIAAIATQMQQFAASPGQWFADHGISSTEQPTYWANGQFTTAAYVLQYYYSLGQAGRQAIQDQMVATGLLSASSATGLLSGSSLTAFKDLVGSAAAQGTDAIDWLNSNATPEAQIQEQISANLTAAQKALSAPEVVTQENPTTLAATIINAFDQTLGYAPSQAQVDAFISGIHSQDAAYGNAPRDAAQAEIAQAKSETAALDALGPDGVDKVISAYAAAVHGSGLAGAGTPQGPISGYEPMPSKGNLAPGTQLPEGTTVRYGPNGEQIGANLLPTERQPTMGATKMVPRGLWDQIAYSLEHNTFSVPYEAQPSSGNYFVPRGGGLVPPAPAGSHGPAMYGGLFALSQADWQEAIKDYAPAAKYKTPGSAPQAIQQAAFTALLLKAYSAHNDSWAQAIAAIAAGTPFGTSKGVNVTNFGIQVANQVNAQIASLQNEVNTSPVTVKVTAPDAAAEANMAAKQADPTDYMAAQTASWGEILNQMLQGSPVMYDQSTADTFTGPVGLGAVTSSGPTPVGVG